MNKRAKLVTAIVIVAVLITFMVLCKVITISVDFNLAGARCWRFYAVSRVTDKTVGSVDNAVSFLLSAHPSKWLRLAMESFFRCFAKRF